MATQYQNLSGYDPDVLPPAEILQQQRYAIAVADWNPEVTYSLLQAAVDAFVKQGVYRSNIKIIHVPGTFELTYAAARLVQDKDAAYHGVVVLGCVVQGETPHFTYVCEGVTAGITQLNTLVDAPPVVF